jgi:hypothetical protein
VNLLKLNFEIAIQVLTPDGNILSSIMYKVQAHGDGLNGPLEKLIGIKRFSNRG